MAVGENNIAGIREGMKPHTMYSEVIEIAKDLKELRVDCLITLRGGSLIDGGKGAILALANDEPNNTFSGSSIPMISIPTTLSGGEYNAYGACTNDITHQKQLFGNHTHEPHLVILDPALTFTTPMRVWASTGVRAIDHCLEALCSIKSNEEANADFIESLRLLITGLLECTENTIAYEPRQRCQFGCMSYMKVMVLKIPLGASHGIGRQLGHYRVPLGETSCILMPAVAKYNARVNAAQQKKVLDVLWDDSVIAGVLKAYKLEKGKADLGDAMDAIIRQLRMPRDLKSVGVTSDSLDAIAVNSLNDPWCRTNPVPLNDISQVMDILAMVVGSV